MYMYIKVNVVNLCSLFTCNSALTTEVFSPQNQVRIPVGTPSGPHQAEVVVRVAPRLQPGCLQASPLTACVHFSHLPAVRPVLSST